MTTHISGRKVDASIENPIDNIMINISEWLSPYFRKMNYTPNGITTVSLIFGIASLYNLYHHNVYQFAIYFILAHLFDCMDGYYARKYHMVSDTGDKYDHIKDLIIVISFVLIMYKQYNVTDFPVLLLVVCVMAVLSIMSVNCHEKITHKDHKSDTLKVFDFVTPDKEKCLTYTNYLKYFGPGTLVLVVVAAVIYIEWQQPVSNNGQLSDNQMRDILDISKPFNGFGSVNRNPFL